jgi:hypothetical protein
VGIVSLEWTLSVFLWSGFLYLGDYTFCNWQKLYSCQKLPKLHPSHKRIRGLMESLTSSREHATFAISIAESYGRSGKVKENPWSMVFARRPCLIVSLMYS